MMKFWFAKILLLLGINNLDVKPYLCFFRKSFMRVLSLIVALGCCLTLFAQENTTLDPSIYKKNGKRKNGMYLSLMVGGNGYFGAANYRETREISPVASSMQDYELFTYPGLDLGLNLELDFGTHASLYLEPQLSVENGVFDDNGNDVLVTTASGHMKLMFGYDLGAQRGFTFRAGTGIMGYTFPLIDGEVLAVPAEEDIILTPSMYFGMEWNATQWFIMGVEHRRLFNFPNEVRLRYNSFGEAERYRYDISNFRVYLKLRLMFLRYR